MAVIRGLVYAKRRELGVFGLCLLSAFSVFAICDKNSFLYVFNPDFDPHCYFSVGKAMAHGIVPYAGIYEQKGPLLYVLWALAYLMSAKTLVGAYVIESLFYAAFLYISWKILCLYITRSASCVCVPVLATVIACTRGFSMSGAEKLCIPFLAYALFCSLRALKEERFFTRRELLLNGFLAGCVLWIKYTMLGLYIAWIIVPLFLLLRQREYKRATASFGWIFAGVAAATLPFVIYFGVHHAIGDWFQVYFYDNIFRYAGSHLTSHSLSGILRFIAENFAMIYMLNPLFGIFAVIGMVWIFFCGKITEKINILILFLFLGLGMYAGGITFMTYHQAFCIFTVLGFVPPLQYLLGKLPSLAKPRVVAAVLVFLLAASPAAAYALFPETDMMKMTKDDYVEFDAAEPISQTESPTLLVFGHFPPALYTVTGIVPNCRFFALMNADSPEKYAEQARYIEEQLIDYIFVDFFTNNYSWYTGEFAGYELIADYEDGTSRFYGYRLYRKQGLVPSTAG